MPSLDKSLAYVQAITGLGFGAYVVAHLGGHILANYSFTLAEQALFAVREVFHHPWVELSLVGGCLILHQLSSGMRVFLRGKREQQAAVERGKKTDHPSAKSTAAHAPHSATAIAKRNLTWHRYTGYILGAMVYTHIAATRIVPLMYLPDPSVIDLTYVTAFFQSFHPVAFVAYGIFGGAAIYHGLYGVQKSLALFRGGSSRFVPLGWWPWIGVGGTVVMLSTCYAIAGGYERISIPMSKEWAVLKAKMIPAALKSLLNLE